MTDEEIERQLCRELGIEEVGDGGKRKGVAQEKAATADERIYMSNSLTAAFAARPTAKGGNSNFAKLNNGKNTVRLLPPKGPDAPFFTDASQHYVDGVFVACGGKDCPVCKGMKWQNSIADKAERKEFWNRFKKSERWLWNAVVNGEQKVIQMPKTVMDDVQTIITDPDTGVGDVTDAAKGYDLFVTKKDDGGRTVYAVANAKAPSAVQYDAEAMVDLVEFAADQIDMGKLAEIAEEMKSAAGKA